MAFFFTTGRIGSDRPPPAATPARLVHVHADAAAEVAAKRKEEKCDEKRNRSDPKAGAWRDVHVELACRLIHDDLDRPRHVSTLLIQLFDLHGSTAERLCRNLADRCYRSLWSGCMLVQDDSNAEVSVHHSHGHLICEERHDCQGLSRGKSFVHTVHATM